MKVRENDRAHRWGPLAAALGTWAMLAAAPAVAQTDVCGCADSTASLGAFDTESNSLLNAVYDEPTNRYTIALPADGVLVYDSFRLVGPPGDSSGTGTLVFTRNAANTPVTLLIQGDIEIGTGMVVSLNGVTPPQAVGDAPAQGGLGGPGGYPGGDGAYPFMNGASQGGSGVGPGGGATRTDLGGGGGTLVASSDLLPLLGGSGGAGGASLSAVFGAAAGAGGGGGGAIVVAANGAVEIDGVIRANGGGGGKSSAGDNDDRSGGGGSGGAIRILAPSIFGGGAIQASGGAFSNDSSGQSYDGLAGGGGRIRLESPDHTGLPGSASDDSITTRVNAIGPVVSAIAGNVTILTVGGVAVPTPPQGSLDIIDFSTPAPGDLPVEVRTTNIPAGTGVAVTFRSKLGGTLFTQTDAIDPGNCDGAGVCTQEITVLNVPAADYTVEARATFQTP